MAWDIWLIFFFLAVVLPWRGRARMRKLLAMPSVGTMERLVLYASTIAFQWAIVAVVGWRAWVHHYSAEELGLTIHGETRILLASVCGAAILGTLHWLNLRRMGRMPVKARALLSELAERILPQDSLELLPYIALALTAGVCEEFLYRGFAMAALHRAGLPLWAALLLSAILFGLAHVYQGRGGFVSTLVIGAVFGGARIAYDGLVPAIFWHTTVDVVAGVAGPRYLRGAGREAEPTPQN